MAKKPDRPRKVFVNDKKDMLHLVDLISSSKEDKAKERIAHKKSVLAKPTKPKASEARPKPGELKLREAKALAAARVHEKKSKKKQAKKQLPTGQAALEPEKEKARKKVSFG